MKMFEELYYKFKLSTFLMNYAVDRTACDILSTCLNSGIKNVDRRYGRLVINFNNEVEINYWNENKYYAWLSEAIIKKNGKELYSYHSKMVTAKLMFKLEEALKEHLIKSISL